MLILGIETSCDETGVALVEAKGGRFVVHKNLVYSQIKTHAKYGGVVPEVAARRHVEKIMPLLQQVISNSRKPDVIAVTAGPGLATSLLVGVETARTLSYLWKKPLVAVNHLEGHIYANWLPALKHENIKTFSPRADQPMAEKQLNNRTIEQSNDERLRPKADPPRAEKPKFQTSIFPALVLIVSGGHTELILMKDHLKYKLIGETRDDAAGECFDKVGKILGLPYPGGPQVAKMAMKGNPQAIAFPRPMINSLDCDFSFSGLKTAVLYHMKSFPPKGDQPMAKKHENMKTIEDVCASFQQAAIDVLVTKTIRAATHYQVKIILLGGGVAANQSLQQHMANAIRSQLQITNPPAGGQFPISAYCGDNAAMIAAAAYFHAIKKDLTPWQKLDFNPNWELI